MVSDLEVLIVIPATSHSAACLAGGHGPKPPTGPHHLQRETRSRGHPTPSTPWVCLEILSIKVMNKIGNKGPLGGSPTLSGNKSDLLPAMQTRLWLWSYREQTAHIRGPNTPVSWRVFSQLQGDHLSLPGKVYLGGLERRVHRIVEPQIQEEQWSIFAGKKQQQGDRLIPKLGDFQGL